MGKHSKQVARGYRGVHRAPTTAGRNVARVATAGAMVALPVSVVSPAYADTPVQTTSFSAQGGFDHDMIAKCESGGNASAQNKSSSASGLYQFIDGTWKAYGGSTKRAKDASVAEQRRVAERAYAAEGYTPWNASKSCWGGKTGSGTKVKVTGENEQRVTPKSDKRVAKSAPKVKQVAPKQVAPKSKHVAPKSDAGSHRVVAGETLSTIALTETGSANWSELYSHNRVTIGANPHMILPGQVITIPGGK